MFQIERVNTERYLWSLRQVKKVHSFHWFLVFAYYIRAYWTILYFSLTLTWNISCTAGINNNSNGIFISTLNFICCDATTPTEHSTPLLAQRAPTTTEASKEQMDPWGLFQYWSKSVFHPLLPVFPAGQGCLISTPSPHYTLRSGKRFPSLPYLIKSLQRITARTRSSFRRTGRRDGQSEQQLLSVNFSKIAAKKFTVLNLLIFNCSTLISTYLQFISKTFNLNGYWFTCKQFMCYFCSYTA